MRETGQNPLHTASEYPLVVIAGPTGSGKSSLALALASLFDGEILNCDSLQIFRCFDIGTAKLASSERRGIPHHLIDCRNPDEVFTAGEYAREGRLVLNRLRQSGRLPIVAGGTGFYLRALLDGLAPGPERDMALRERLAARERRRPQGVHRLLRRFDPGTAARIHPNDIPKAIRAVEICLSARKPAGEVFRLGRDALQGFRFCKIGLFPNRDLLYERLDRRVEQMFESGMIEEVRSILDRGYASSVKPFESIGYKQALQCVQGELSRRDAIFYAKRDTRRYAKRQMTWFRQEAGMVPVAGFGDDPATVQQVVALVERFLARS